MVQVSRDVVRVTTRGWSIKLLIIPQERTVEKIRANEVYSGRFSGIERIDASRNEGGGDKKREISFVCYVPAPGEGKKTRIITGMPFE